MGQKTYEVIFYVRKNGHCPTKDFLDSLSPRDLVLVNKAFERLQKYGLGLKRPYVAPLRDKIWELRIHVERVQYRFLYFFHDGKQFIITHGIKKKTGKVPPGEIDKAIECRNDYRERVSKG